MAQSTGETNGPQGVSPGAGGIAVSWSPPMIQCADRTDDPSSSCEALRYTRISLELRIKVPNCPPPTPSSPRRATAGAASYSKLVLIFDNLVAEGRDTSSPASSPGEECKACKGWKSRGHYFPSRDGKAHTGLFSVDVDEVKIGGRVRTSRNIEALDCHCRKCSRTAMCGHSWLQNKRKDITSETNGEVSVDGRAAERTERGGAGQDRKKANGRGEGA
ncbi:hypothetical protein BJV74DRAFT_798999 [Russula compacta]|nr:hypothetical protein BJV74DRAFT_798999 [Russula compacta]